MSAAAATAPNTDLFIEFRRLMDDTHAAYKTALAEKLELGEVKGETKERMVKLETAVAEFIDKNTALQAEHTALQTEVRSMKERGSRPPVKLGATGEMDFRSIGSQFTDTDAFKSNATNSPQRPKVQVTLKSRMIQPREVRANPFIAAETSGLVIPPQRVGVVFQPVIPLVMRDIVTVVPLSATSSVEYVIETFTNNADYQVLQGDRKAQSDLTYTDAVAQVRTIAHFVKISRQMVQDAPYVAATIDNRLLYGIALKEDKEILYGNNAAGHLFGIMPQASAYVAPPGIGTITNRVDQMYAAIVQVYMSGHIPTAIVLNPVDLAVMNLMKTTQGVYLLGGPPMSEAPPRLWGLPVAITANMNVGDFLVGAFPGNAVLFDRESANVEMATENEDDFVRNLVTMRGEERVALAVFVPQAFVKGTLLAASLFEAGTESAPGRGGRKGAEA